MVEPAWPFHSNSQRDEEIFLLTLQQTLQLRMPQLKKEVKDSDEAPQRLARAQELVSIRGLHMNGNVAVKEWREAAETQQYSPQYSPPSRRI